MNLQEHSSSADLPLVTIAFLSWNRLHYLKATVESARECIQYPRLEWIISDNKSEEPGLREYIKNLDWVDLKIFRTQGHAEAMNELISLATGKYVMIWPEDVQFVKKGAWLTDIVDILENNPWVGSVGINYLRKITNRRLFTMERWLAWRLLLKELFYFGHKFRFPARLRSSRGFEIRTLGHLWPGICGSGIPTLTRTEIWRRMGGWRVREERNTKNLLDSSLGAEADMVQRFYERGEALQQAVLSRPVAADIVTDPIGSKAKVRGGKRYGVYLPPPNGLFYYQIGEEDPSNTISPALPLSFEACVTPLGFSLPLDGEGNLLKADHVNLEVVHDILPDTTVGQTSGDSQ
jgi:glycosyltransferase involved in cell wall biosynthesis